MADEKQVAILEQGPKAWNVWRLKHSGTRANLGGACSYPVVGRPGCGEPNVSLSPRWTVALLLLMPLSRRT